MFIKTPTFPSNIQIEINNFCNARCTFCPVPTMTRKPRIMKFDLFERIIRELQERDFAGHMYPFLNGEPLLVPDFTDYLELIREKVPRASIELTTNASRLDTEIGRKILKQGVLDIIRTSFDGGTKETYESIRRGLSFEQVRDNIHFFLDERKRLGKDKPRVEINMVLTPENYYTKQQLAEEFKDADSVNFCLMFNWGGQLEKGAKGNSFLSKSNFCYRMYRFLTILVTGEVALCCYDYEGKEIVGNINFSSMEEVWRGETFEGKREQLKKRQFDKLPLCRECDFINHNLVAQQMLKIRSLLELNFPNVANFGTDLYKRAVARGPRYRG